MRSRIHELWVFRCGGCERGESPGAARRVDSATVVAGGASSGPSEPDQPWSTDRRILEVAPYGYNLYLNPHESTPVPYASGPDPLVVRDRASASPHSFMEWNR